MSQELTLTVTGMTCGGCEHAIRRALSTMDGVASVAASYRELIVTVVYDPARADCGKIAGAIEAAGYAVAG